MYSSIFFNLAARWFWVVNATPRPLYPRERHGTHCTGGWVGPTACLVGCGKPHPPPGFDPRTVQPEARRYTDWAIPAHDIQVCIINCKWFMTMHGWFIMRNKTNKCTYRYLNLLYYSLLHVSATYFGHLHGDVPFKIYYTERQNICDLNYIDVFM
jgi:hypothetical protein